MSAPTESPLRKRVEAIIRDAVAKRASDIHFECFENRAGTRLRIDGVLYPCEDMTKEDYREVGDEIKRMANLEVEDRSSLRDGRIQLPDGLDVRLNVCPTCYGESIVMRLLDRRQVCLELSRCGMNEAQLAAVERWCRRPSGLVLATGPTGSGKTTLLYAMLAALNQPTVKICSIEDPVEFAITGVNQVAVNPRCGITFAAAMRAVLRQAPNIVMVGEIRDYESCVILAQMAMTGHLALSTLHANTTTDAVIRMKDIGVLPFMIADTLNGVVAPRLVRQLCTECREEYEPEETARRELGLEAGTLFRARGCAACNKTGYKGRLGIFELFELDDDGKQLLSQGSAGDLRRHALASGMVSLWQDGLAKAAQGLTSVEELVRVAEPD